MTNFDALDTATERNLLVAFFDLTRYAAMPGRWRCWRSKSKEIAG